MKQTDKDYHKLRSQLDQKERELYSIQRIGKALSSTLRLDELLSLIMKEITILMEADRSTLFLVDHASGEIWSKIALKAEVKEIRLPIGKGISGFVAETGDTINISDAYQDDRFDPATDSKTGYRTRSILCMPIWEPQTMDSGKKKILGVIQVLNKKDGVFTWDDESLMETLASQVAISIANSRLYYRLEKKFKEIDLLYDFEQLLSSVNELSDMLKKLLGKTVEHLQARTVIAIFPTEEGFCFAGADDKQRASVTVVNSVSLGMRSFLQNPSLELLIDCMPDLHEQLRIPDDLDLEKGARIFSTVHIDDEKSGILFAIGVQSGQMQRFEDERKMIELVGQKISRASELNSLRETLLKRERLSAIGQLMSTVVHDIRGPVNTIYGFVDLMRDVDTSIEERDDYGNIIRQEIQSLTNMIQEVLDFSKGKTSILPRKSSVTDVLRRFKPRLEQMCQKGNVDLRIEVNSDKLLHVDEEKIMRVFYNISKNGLEAMNFDGVFTVHVDDEDDMVSFHFIDNGSGIPFEIQDRLFDSFVTSGKEQGTGLGLAIVKKIVEEHHGHIDIDSSPGKGATFSIRLPVYK